MKQFRDTKYFITETGEVFNNKTKKYLKILLVEQKKSTHKRSVINLCFNGKASKFYISRLVAECYCDDFDPSCEVNHLDGDPTNNNLSNLECTNKSGNIRHAYDSGLMKTVLNKQLASEIRERYKKENISHSKLAEEYNCGKQTIGDILKGKTWT